MCSSVLFSEISERRVELLYSGEVHRTADLWFVKLQESTEPPIVEAPSWEPKNPQCLSLFEESRKRLRLKTDEVRVGKEWCCSRGSGTRVLAS